MLSKQKIANLLGNDDYYVAQYFGHGFAGGLQGWLFRSRVTLLLGYIKRTQLKPLMTLDVGCGSMFVSYGLIRNGNGQYIGIDLISRDKLKKYRDAMRDMTGEAIEVVRASGDFLPFRDGTFDFVISLDVLEHLKKPKTCAIEIGRAVRTNGIIGISLPMENLFQRLLRINFILMKITDDPTTKGVSLRMIARWMFKVSSYHYVGNIKSFDAMNEMLSELFNLMHADYAPIGFSKVININALLFYSKKIELGEVSG